MGIDVAVAGASGYAGGELLRLIAGHPDLRLVAAAADANAGRALAEVHPQLRSYADVELVPATPETLAADVVFLALPHGASAALAAELPDGALVVDLGADFRLADPAAWQRFYGGTHAGTWPYGLPELPGTRARLTGARRIANPGCYPTATILALAPLLAAGLVEREGIVVVAASGTSGAGRAAKSHLLGSEVMGDLSPYKVAGAHQHIPEISQALGGVALSFTPILAPLPRGMLATVSAPLRPGVGTAELRAALAAAYDAEPFVHLLAEGSWPHTAATFGSNSCHLQVAADPAAGRAVVVSAIDNLGKGAAGQALQNANIALGLPETAGLPVDGTAP